MRPLYLHGHSRPLTHLLFNSDGDLLFSAGKDAGLSVWWSNRGEVAGTYDCGKGVVSNIDCTLDSQTLIAASLDQKVLVFDVETGRNLCDFKVGGPCRYVEWNRKPLEQTKFVLVHDHFIENTKAIEIYEYNEGDPTMILELTDYTSRCLHVHWGAFDATIISGHANGAFMVWDSATGSLLYEIEAHDKALTCMSFSDDRLLMLTCCEDGTAKLWETVSFTCIKVYKTDRPLNACGISPLYKAKGSRRRCHVLLGGGQKAEDVTQSTALEGKFQSLIYHMVRGDELGSCKGHFGPINTLQWMPDGAGFASGGEDGYVRLYKFDDVYFSDKFK